MKRLAVIALGGWLLAGSQASVLQLADPTTTGYYYPNNRWLGDDCTNAGGVANFVQLAYYNGNPVPGTFDAEVRLVNSDARFNNFADAHQETWLGLPNDPNFSFTVSGLINGGADVPVNPQAVLAWKPSQSTAGLLVAPATPLVGNSDNKIWYDTNNDGIVTNSELYWFGGSPYANFRVGYGRVGPKAIRIVQGADENGGIAELFFDDSAAFSLFNDSETLFAIFEVDLDTFSLAPTQLDFGFKYEVGRGGLAYNYKLFNFTTNAFVTIGGNVAATSWETVTYQNTTNADDFVDANGMVTARFSFGPINDEALHKTAGSTRWST